MNEKLTILGVETSCDDTGIAVLNLLPCEDNPKKINLTVLSNDKFDKKFDDKFFIQAADRLKQKGLIRRVGVIDGKLTIM